VVQLHPAPGGRRLATPAEAWENLFFGGYPELLKPPGSFCQMLVELGDLEHRELQASSVVAHRFGSTASQIGLLEPMVCTLERHPLTMPQDSCDRYSLSD
jgi:hypothetical protein